MYLGKNMKSNCQLIYLVYSKLSIKFLNKYTLRLLSGLNALTNSLKELVVLNPFEYFRLGLFNFHLTLCKIQKSDRDYLVQGQFNKLLEVKIVQS